MKSLATCINYRSSLSWVLSVALVLMSLLPVHYHMQHVDAGADETSVTTHVTDLHFHSDSQAGNHHSASHTLSPADDISLKQPNTVQPPLLAVLLLALMFVALNPSSLRTNWRSSRVQHYFNQHRNTPPLRAPPHA